jgi:hypothetical protein
MARGIPQDFKSTLALGRKSTGSEFVLLKARSFKIVQNYGLWALSVCF